MMSDLLVIIPAYNEAANIERVVSHLAESFPQYDYIVNNDGSRDKTAEICRRNQFHLLDLPVNLGLSGVFQAGIRYACEKGYSSVIQFDGDGQHRPEFIGRMKKKLDEGYDIVIGSRFVNAKKSASLRMLGSRMLSLAIRITTGAVIHDPTSGMRMFNRKMMEEFAAGLNYSPEPDTISWLIRRGAKVAEVPVLMDERSGGKSYLTPVTAARYMIQMLVSILFIQNFRKKDE